MSMGVSLLSLTAFTFYMTIIVPESLPNRQHIIKHLPKLFFSFEAFFLIPEKNGEKFSNF
jgi:hypothetical protein